MEQEEIGIGQVKAIYLYPVKSMHGISLEEASIGWNGLERDRAYAFVRSESRSDFPWLTGRQVPRLLTYHPFFLTGSRRPLLQVQTPEGQNLPIDSAELREDIERRYGKPVFLLQNQRGNYDSHCLSILTTASIAKLSELTGLELQAQRFRPNILIEASSPQPFQEDTWIGKSLRFGLRSPGVCVEVNLGIDRCVMVNLDPEEANSNPNVLKQVFQSHQNIFGVYASTHTPGVLHVGDQVFLQRP